MRGETAAFFVDIAFETASEPELGLENAGVVDLVAWVHLCWFSNAAHFIDSFESGAVFCHAFLHLLQASWVVSSEHASTPFVRSDWLA